MLFGKKNDTDTTTSNGTIKKKKSISNDRRNQDGTFLDNGLVLDGSITGNDDVEIQANIKGDIKIKSNLIIGNNGNVDAEIEAKNITILGKVKGTLKLEEKLRLESTAVLDGKIITSHLITSDGAIFNGTCEMKK